MNLMKGLRSFLIGFHNSRRLRFAKTFVFSEVDIYAEEYLIQEIAKEDPTRAQRIEHCKSELRRTCYPDAVILGAFGEEIFSAALAES